jgi:hypothetical protein
VTVIGVRASLVMARLFPDIDLIVPTAFASGPLPIPGGFSCARPRMARKTPNNARTPGRTKPPVRGLIIFCATL